MTSPAGAAGTPQPTPGAKQGAEQQEQRIIRAAEEGIAAALRVLESQRHSWDATKAGAYDLDFLIGKVRELLPLSAPAAPVGEQRSTAIAADLMIRREIVVADLVMLVKRLARALRKHDHGSALAAAASDYLNRKNLHGSALRVGEQSSKSSEKERGAQPATANTGVAPAIPGLVADEQAPLAGGSSAAPAAPAGETSAAREEAIPDGQEYYAPEILRSRLRAARERIAELEKELRHTTTERDYWLHKGEEVMAICAEADPTTEGMVPDRAAFNAILTLRNRLAALQAEQKELLDTATGLRNALNNTGDFMDPNEWRDYKPIVTDADSVLARIREKGEKNADRG